MGRAEKAAGARAPVACFLLSWRWILGNRALGKVIELGPDGEMDSELTSSFIDNWPVETFSCKVGSESAAVLVR